jgi:hypothetical protein
MDDLAINGASIIFSIFAGVAFLLVVLLVAILRKEGGIRTLSEEINEAMSHTGRMLLRSNEIARSSHISSMHNETRLFDILLPVYLERFGSENSATLMEALSILNEISINL